MIDYEVGQIPNRGLGITVKDDRDNAMSLIGYDNIALEILGTDNEKVDLTGVVINEVATLPGTVTVEWPRTRSIFTKKGKYLMRLILTKADGTRDYTRAEQIIVRDFGRLKN